jgi:hypothetical protein
MEKAPLSRRPVLSPNAPGFATETAAPREGFGLVRSTAIG